MISIKSQEEIEKIRSAGKILAEVAKILRKNVKVGVTTQYLDDLAEKEFKRKDVISAFKGYRGYPKNICASINEEVVHGIPDERKLAEGDILSLDLGVKLGKYFADMAFTEPVGKIDSCKKKLISVTREALRLAIKQVRPGNRIHDISHAVQSYVESQSFSVVREFVGHGIGTELHEEPQIPNFGKSGTGELIKEGMVFAIEPMVNVGVWQVDILDNGWTAVTVDRKPSCHFEHTIVALSNGPCVLTE